MAVIDRSLEEDEMGALRVATLPTKMCENASQVSAEASIHLVGAISQKS